MIPAQTLDAGFPAASPAARLVALAEPRSAAAEEYRVLFHRVAQLAARRPARIVAVTSAGRGEGRTTTAANLALTAVGEGRTAVLVEADLRRPALAELMGLAPRPGLLQVLEGTAELSQAVARVGGLSVLCAGEGRDPEAAARSPRAAAVLEALRAGHELVILDAPPALAFADGDRLAAAAEVALLVVRAGVTPRRAVAAALEALGERAAGIVVNAADEAGRGRWLHADGPPPALARGA